jgi:hypothetical protein
MAMGNQWTKGTDPNGKWFGLDDIIVSAVGFVTGYVSYGLTKGNWGGKALLSGLTGAVIAEGGYLTLGGGLATASTALPAATGASASEAAAAQVTAATGFAGTMGAAESFAASYAASDIFTLYSQRDQIHESSDWAAFGLIAGYSLLSSISTGLNSKWSEVKVDKFFNVSSDAEFAGGTSNAIGSDIASFGKDILKAYDPVQNTWKPDVNQAFKRAFLEVTTGALLGKEFENEDEADGFFIDFKSQQLQTFANRYGPGLENQTIQLVNRIVWEWAFTHL